MTPNSIRFVILSEVSPFVCERAHEEEGPLPQEERMSRVFS